MDTSSRNKPKTEFFLTTGTPDFSQLFYGDGIRVHPDEGTSVLIEGAAGLGKTTLALQLCATAVSSGNASCLYYSFEQSTRELGEMITAYGWGIDDDVDTHPWRSDEVSFTRRFNLVDAHEVIGLSVDSTLDTIERHAHVIDSRFSYLSPLVVLDSIGAIEELITLERRHLSRLIGRMNRWKAVLILVREKQAGANQVPSEYLTNVVVDLQTEHSLRLTYDQAAGFSYPMTIPRNLLELKKTRNQRAHRGPHQFTIAAASAGRTGGIEVYPALQSIAGGGEDTRPGLAIESDDRATFGMPKLDEKLGHLDSENNLVAGMPFGQSLLVKGLPGSLKTELGVQFLLQALQEPKEEQVLFVSCRIDRSALEGLEIYPDRETKSALLEQRLQFIDARHPFRTPEQIMAAIAQTVEGSHPSIRRAVIFGIGMLDTLPAFQRNALPFLQVLSSYFRVTGVSGIFIDWPRPHEERALSNQLVRPTELAGDFVAGALEISREESAKELKHSRRRLTLLRKNHRFVNEQLGYLSLSGCRLLIDE